MRTNVGGWDRNVRWLVGGGALAAAALVPLSLPWRMGLLALGATNLLTAATRYCPVNELAGINTAGEGVAEEVGSTARSAMQSLAE